jgi:uncharacterized protein YdeI (YjbR/CyaY-like superfamily)
MKPNPQVDWYFRKSANWRDEVTKLRAIALGSGLEEVLKWGCPCYAQSDSNVVLIHVFKHYCALLFFRGAAINDPEGVLIQQTKNVQSARQMRFTSAAQIDEMTPTIQAYIKEAIVVDDAGIKVEFKKTAVFEMPVEFQEQLDELPELKTAFYALTPGRQRAYLLHFAGAKQSKTRAARVQKYTQQILNGKGIDD